MKALVVSRKPDDWRALTRWLDERGLTAEIRRPTQGRALQANHPFSLTLSDEEPAPLTGAGIRCWVAPDRRSLKDFPPGYDFAVCRPFSLQALWNVVQESQERVARSRSTLAWIGGSSPAVSAPAGPWSRIQAGLNPGLAMHHIGAWIVDPTKLTRNHLRMLRTWRRSPAGQTAVWVCLQDGARDFHNLYPLFHIYASTRSSLEASFLQKLATRRDRSFELCVGIRLVRQHLRQGLAHEALESARNLMARVPLAWEPMGLAAEALGALERGPEAAPILKAALALNPYSPRLHLQLMRLTDPEDHEAQQIRDEARAFCPIKFSEIVRLSTRAELPA